MNELKAFRNPAKDEVDTIADCLHIHCDESISSIWYLHLEWNGRLVLPRGPLCFAGYEYIANSGHDGTGLLYRSHRATPFPYLVIGDFCRRSSPHYGLNFYRSILEGASLSNFSTWWLDSVKFYAPILWYVRHIWAKFQFSSPSSIWTRPLVH